MLRSSLKLDQLVWLYYLSRSTGVDVEVARSPGLWNSYYRSFLYNREFGILLSSSGVPKARGGDPVYVAHGTLNKDCLAPDQPFSPNPSKKSSPDHPPSPRWSFHVLRYQKDCQSYHSLLRVLWKISVSPKKSLIPRIYRSWIPKLIANFL